VVSQLPCSQNTCPGLSHNGLLRETPVRGGFTITETETGTGDDCPVRSGNLCKPRGPCVLPAGVVSLLISSFKLLAHVSSLVSWGFWLYVPYSSVIPCHGGLQPPFTSPVVSPVETFPFRTITCLTFS
jgi:hypothetical protein